MQALCENRVPVLVVQKNHRISRLWSGNRLLQILYIRNIMGMICQQRKRDRYDYIKRLSVFREYGT